MKKLRRAGYWAFRLPASGRKSQADVVAIKRNRILIFEVKRRREPRIIYLSKWRVWNARNIEERTGGEYYLILYIVDNMEWLARRITDWDTETDKAYGYSANGSWLKLDNIL